MKRRRNTGIAVLLILLAFLAFATITPSVMQNRNVRHFADQLFRAYQTRDKNDLQKYYTIGLSNPYLKLLDQYVLLGWKVTRISGQPYPAELSRSSSAGGDSIYNTVSADLYYKPVDKLIKPQGRYSRMKHPEYGDCMVVPITISYSYQPQQEWPWTLKHPATDDPNEWVLPFDKPLSN